MNPFGASPATGDRMIGDAAVADVDGTMEMELDMDTAVHFTRSQLNSPQRMNAQQQYPHPVYQSRQQQQQQQQSMDAPKFPQSFTQLVDTFVAGSIRLAQWCPTMDLLAIVVQQPGNSTISIPTLSILRLQGERLFTLTIDTELEADDDIVIESPIEDLNTASSAESTDTTSASADEFHSSELYTTNTKNSEVNCCSVRCIAWHPDGKTLALGLSSGAIHIVSIELKNVIMTYNNVHKSSIVTMHWAEALTSKQPNNHSKDALPNSHSIPNDAASYEIPSSNVFIDNISLKYNDRTSQIFPPLPTLDLSSNTPNGPPQFASPNSSSAPTSELVFSILTEAQQPNVLLSADALGNIHARMFGIFPLFTINAFQLLSKELGSSFPSFHKIISKLKIFKMAMNPHFNLITVLCCYPITGSTFAINYSTPNISSRIHELSLISRHIQTITYLLSYLNKTLTGMESRWNAVRRSINLKFAAFVDQNRDSGISTEDELLQLLLTGIPSQSLKEYIQSTFSASALLRQHSAMDATLLRLLEMYRTNAIPCCDELLFRLCEIRSHARWIERAKCIGLELEPINIVINHATILLSKLDQLHFVMLSARKNFNAFFPWLTFAVFSLADSDDVSEQTPIHSGPFDYDSIIDCLTYDLLTDRVGNQLSSSTPLEPICTFHPQVELQLPETLKLQANSLSLSFRASLANTKSSFASVIPQISRKISTSFVLGTFLHPDSLVSMDGPYSQTASIFANSILHLFESTAEMHSSAVGIQDEELYVVNSLTIDALQQRTSIWHNSDENSVYITFVFTHPLLRISHVSVLKMVPIITDTQEQQPSTSPSRPAFDVELMLAQSPGWPTTSPLVMVSMANYNSDSLLILTRHPLTRRSSERDRATGLGTGGFSRLWLVNVKDGITYHVLTSEELYIARQLVALNLTSNSFIPGFSVSDFILSQLEQNENRTLVVYSFSASANETDLSNNNDNPSILSFSENEMDHTEKIATARHRLLHSTFGREVISGSQRGVCAVLVTGNDSRRSRQQRKRIVVLDVRDDEDDEVDEHEEEGDEDEDEDVANEGDENEEENEAD